MEALKSADPEIARLIAAEADRQEHQLEMIASENFASKGTRASATTAGARWWTRWSGWRRSGC